MQIVRKPTFTAKPSGSTAVRFESGAGSDKHNSNSGTPVKTGAADRPVIHRARTVGAPELIKSISQDVGELPHSEIGADESAFISQDKALHESINPNDTTVDSAAFSPLFSKKKTARESESLPGIQKNAGKSLAAHALHFMSHEDGTCSLGLFLLSNIVCPDPAPTLSHPPLFAK